jgi:hypothetical protein
MPKFPVLSLFNREIEPETGSQQTGSSASHVMISKTYAGSSSLPAVSTVILSSEDPRGEIKYAALVSYVPGQE